MIPLLAGLLQEGSWTKKQRRGERVEGKRKLRRRKMKRRATKEARRDGVGESEKEGDEDSPVCSLFLLSEVMCFYINGWGHVSSQGQS